MDLSLKGKRAFLSASSRGIGLGVAQVLAAEGARLHLGARDLVSLERTAKTLEDQYGQAVSFAPLDMSRGPSINEWAQIGLQQLGGADLALVNAGGPPAGAFLGFEEAHWQGAFETNLLSAVRLIRALLPSMTAQGAGSLLCITSTAVKEPLEGLILSNVMRAGVAALVKSLSRELGPQGIRINNLMPGRIDTDRIASLDAAQGQARGTTAAVQRKLAEQSIPLRRYGTIEEMGQAAAFLLSDAASYLSGQSLALDGGLLKAL
ncbi:MAG: SDR family oxidoreductase [bacterium]|nr:SDR family oxidoreductase [bacterium]